MEASETWKDRAREAQDEVDRWRSEAERLTSSLAAANQQLDAMRAERDEAKRNEESARKDMAVQLRIALDLGAELAALKTQLDAWPSWAPLGYCTAGHPDVRLVSWRPAESEHRIACPACLFAELAALRQSTEADAKPVRGDWVARCNAALDDTGDETCGRLATWRCAQDNVYRCDQHRHECIEPVAHPAPVAPAPGTSEVVAWRSDVHRVTTGFVLKCIEDDTYAMLDGEWTPKRAKAWRFSNRADAATELSDGQYIHSVRIVRLLKR